VKIRVFLVEDHPLMMSALKKSLERNDSIAFMGEAHSGEKALEILSEIPRDIDVVVMDLGLPGMSGIETTRRLKKEHPGLHVLMFTVHRLEEEIFSSFQSGADGYCLKETDIVSLLLGIQAVSMGSLYIDPQIAHLAARRIQSPTFRDEGNHLTPRETEVLKLLSEGFSNKELAMEFQISLSTVKAHIQSILQKLSATTRADAAVKAIKKGLI
jgi:DNA-binding NarL/FixJ family response regulator